MALAFTIDNRLYLYRRESKPLYFAQTGSGIYYSSRYEGLCLAGFYKQVEEFPVDEFVGFENGVMIDRRYYGEPQVNPKVVDVKPSEWRSKVSDEEAKIVPEDKRHYNYYDDDYYNGRRTNNNAQKELFNKDKNRNYTKEPIIKRFQDRFDKALELNEIPINSGTVADCESPDSDRSYVVVQLVDATSKDEALKDWSVFLDHDIYGTYRASSENGVSVIDLNTDKKKFKTRLILVPPKREYAYYSKIIEIEKASVLEVTLSLAPFLDEEEEKGKKSIASSDNSTDGDEGVSHVYLPFVPDVKKADSKGHRVERSKKSQKAEKLVTALLGKIPFKKVITLEGAPVYLEEYTFPTLIYELYLQMIDIYDSEKEIYDLLVEAENEISVTGMYQDADASYHDQEVRNMYMAPVWKLFNEIEEDEVFHSNRILLNVDKGNTWDFVYEKIYNNLIDFATDSEPFMEFLTKKAMPSGYPSNWDSSSSDDHVRYEGCSTDLVVSGRKVTIYDDRVRTLYGYIDHVKNEISNSFWQSYSDIHKESELDPIAGLRLVRGDIHHANNDMHAICSSIVTMRSENFPIGSMFDKFVELRDIIDDLEVRASNTIAYSGEVDETLKDDASSIIEEMSSFLSGFYSYIEDVDEWIYKNANQTEFSNT